MHNCSKELPFGSPTLVCIVTGKTNHAFCNKTAGAQVTNLRPQFSDMTKTKPGTAKRPQYESNNGTHAPAKPKNAAAERR